jgi:4-aminobutyrate aminotransferase-like enzyme
VSDAALGAVAGFTSTGSKRPEALFGGPAADLPRTMTRASGCRVWDTDGREYLDFIMALGAVALGYGHPEVNAAAVRAIGDGVVGPLPPVLEGELALDLRRLIPWVEQVRFLKTGAEAMAAAVRTISPTSASSPGARSFKLAMCRRGTTRRCVGACGVMSLNATRWSF